MGATSTEPSDKIYSYVLFALDNKRFLIMGGSSQTNANSTSEYILSDGTVEAGPITPYIGLEWHCLVRLDDGKVIIINQFNG